MTVDFIEQKERAYKYENTILAHMKQTGSKRVMLSTFCSSTGNSEDRCFLGSIKFFKRVRVTYLRSGVTITTVFEPKNINFIK